MFGEIGKWLLDISKYLITGYVLAKMFGQDDSTWVVIGAVVVAALLFVLDCTVYERTKIKITKRKENSMDTGLFIMYGFLLLLAAGIFIYAKIDDRKEHKRQ